MKNIIVGTAGHIDHGKTALVKALTGIDADRLEEEKRRGITIDLGFAHLELPGGLRARLRRRARPRALHQEHAGRRGRHRPGALRDRRRRVHQAADPRALRYLPPARHPPRHRRAHQVRPGGPRHPRPGPPRGGRDGRRLVPGGRAHRPGQFRHRRGAGPPARRTRRAPPPPSPRRMPPAISACPSTASSPSKASARWPPAR